MTLITKGMGIIRKGVEKLGGSEKGKPHSTRAGRRAAGSRRLKRGFKEISTPFIDESIFIKQFKKMKKDKERTKKGIGGLLSKGFKVLKGPANKFRMDQAQRLKTYRSKQKLKKTKEARIQEGKSKEFQEKYIKPLSPETKVKISKSRHPKSWRRAGKK